MAACQAENWSWSSSQEMGMGVRESTENEWMAGGSLGVVGDITDVYGYVLPLE